MMTIPDDFQVLALLVSNALLVAAGALAILRFRRQCRRLEHFWNSPTGAAVADEGDTGGTHARHQMLTNLRLERQLASLRDELAAIAKARGDTPQSERTLPLDNAVRMAKNGASVDELTRSCGLNIGEAQLIRKMHGTAANAARASA